MTPRFLVITDTHLANGGSELRLDDLSKVALPAIAHPTRETEIGKLFERIASELQRRGQNLDGIFFAGDAQRRGLPGGHEILFDLILENFANVGISPKKIVATPGNHDVKKWSAPGSAERYDAFCSVWKTNGCVVPWLDGIDSPSNFDITRHCLVGPDNKWIVYPLNTSNWSQVAAELPAELAGIWEQIPHQFSADHSRQQQLRAELENLRTYDMAHVSDSQLEAVRRIVGSTPLPATGPQLRILVMHHHLRAPSLRVELKPFEGISNLEQIRRFIGQARINLVIHGHKHEHSVHFEHLSADHGDEVNRVAVLAAGTIDDGRDTDAARVLTVEGLPFTPALKSERFGLTRGGLDVPVTVEKTLHLWTERALKGGPAVVEGTDFDEVYARASRAAREVVPRGTLVVHLDLPDTFVELTLPDGYPEADGISKDERQKWLREIVEWWQLPQSHRDKNFPYPHGSRLQRYGGVRDQIDRLAIMLKNARSSQSVSSRALAVLVDPIRDFNEGDAHEAFPSFTMVQLKKRQKEDGRTALDIVGFYRAQEFSQWWPVNVAELRAIQIKLCRPVDLVPGHITTITTEARLDDRATGQVHVPIFDRWLDLAPQNLFLLAGLLSGQIKDHPSSTELLGQWRRALKDFQTVAQAQSVDGSPISSEGLKALQKYIVTLCPIELPPFYSHFVALVDASEAFEKSSKDRGSFHPWKRAVERVVPEILQATRYIGASAT